MVNQLDERVDASPVDAGDGHKAPRRRRAIVRAFELAVSLPVLAWIAYELPRTAGHDVEAWDVVLWIAVVAIVDLLPIPAWGGLVVSLSFPILVATSLLYPPAVAGLIALVGSSDTREFRRELPLLKALFTRAQMALAIIIGSAAFHSFASDGIDSGWVKLALGAMLATILCYSLNAVIVAGYTAVDYRLHVWKILVEMHGSRPAEFLIAYLGLGLYGTLIARFFHHDGPWAVAAFFAPLVLARQMFFRSRALEITTDELRDRERSLQQLSEQLQQQNEQLEEQAALLHVHLDRERETVAELRQLNRMKSEFVAVASHELRTPLTAIIGYAKALLRPHVADDSAIREEFTVGIAQQGERLMQLVQNLLTASSIESGSITIEVAPVDIADLCDHIVAEFGDRRERIHLDVEPHLPLVQTDRTLLGRVLTNLIDNALKYSDDAMPCDVVVTSSGSTVRLAVRDQGVGIDPAALSHIFERFYQVDSSATRRFGGTGLGLAIVKEILHNLGGTISVESTPGKGSVFTVELPNVSATERAGEPTSGNTVAAAG
jgi:signal transduction histidine kinase